MVTCSLLQKYLRRSGPVQYPKSDLVHEVVWTSWVLGNAFDDYFDYQQGTVPVFVYGSAEIIWDVESL